MSPIGETSRYERRGHLPAVIYFVITFNIIGFTTVQLLREYGFTVSTFVGATPGALLVAKGVLVVVTVTVAVERSDVRLLPSASGVTVRLQLWSHPIKTASVRIPYAQASGLGRLAHRAIWRQTCT
jgi:hypothetical protein